MSSDGRRTRGIFTIRQADAERERRRRIKPRIQRPQVLEAANHKPGCRQEDQRHRNLSAHQQVTHPMAAAADRIAASSLV